MNRREELIELINTLKQDIASRKPTEFEEDFTADMMKAALKKAEEDLRVSETLTNG